MRVLVYSESPEELDMLTSRLEADGHAPTGTVEGELALDLAGASEFEALVIDSRVPPLERLRLVEGVSRRRPDTLVIRSNGPEALITQVRQAISERGGTASRAMLQDAGE